MNDDFIDKAGEVAIAIIGAAIVVMVVSAAVVMATLAWHLAAGWRG